MAEPEMRWARQPARVNALLVLAIVGLSWMLLRATADRRQWEAFSRDLMARAAARQPGSAVIIAPTRSRPNWRADLRGMESRLRALAGARDRVQYALSTLPQLAPVRAAAPRAVREQTDLRRRLARVGSEVPALAASLRSAQGPADVARLAPQERALRARMEAIQVQFGHLQAGLVPPSRR